MAHLQFSTLTNLTFLTSLFLAAILALHMAHAQSPPDNDAVDGSSQSSGFAHHRALLRPELTERGLSGREMDNLLARYAMMAQLLGLAGGSSSTSGNTKRAGWKRIPIQTRFAPFGSKLIPSRSRGDSNGPTLLRYGRSNA